MITDINKLKDLCYLELEQRGYTEKFRQRHSRIWKRFAEWMKKHSITEFNEEVARRYCNDKLGSYLLKPGWSRGTRIELRAIRMLATFQQYGDFECKSPTVDHTLTGPLADAGNEFLDHYSNVLKRCKSTMYNKRLYLNMLCKFLGAREDLPASLSVDDLDAFFKSASSQGCDMVDCCIAVKQFLQFLYERHYLRSDLSIAVPKVSKSHCNKLPTTYTEEEISKLLSAVETTSAIGKRNLLILLLASEYGLRASDITTLEFGDIDWDRNTITHKMKKTGEYVVLPLVAKVGNAIYDYLADENRPKSESPYIVVSHNLATRGRPLTSATLHAVVTQYMKAAGIKDWQKKRHGTHSLRHSLATRMQSMDTSISVIGEVLGHQCVESTSIYLKVDIPRLTMCPLPMPPIESYYYTPEGNHGKV